MFRPTFSLTFFAKVTLILSLSLLSVPTLAHPKDTRLSGILVRRTPARARVFNEQNTDFNTTPNRQYSANNIMTPAPSTANVNPKEISPWRLPLYKAKQKVKLGITKFHLKNVSLREMSLTAKVDAHKGPDNDAFKNMKKKLQSARDGQEALRNNKGHYEGKIIAIDNHTMVAPGQKFMAGMANTVKLKYKPGAGRFH